jgi:hypothetical protein
MKTLLSLSAPEPRYAESIEGYLSDIGRFRPNLTQPFRIDLGSNPTKSDGEYVLSTTIQNVWGFG